MSSIPREVKGKWYPVPLPLGVPVATNFATEAECAAFILGVDLIGEFLKDREEMYDEGYDKGYDEGYEEGKKDAKKTKKKTA
jgi:hypothetical protein